MNILTKIGVKAKSILGGLLSYILSYKVCRNLVKLLIRPKITYQWEAAGENGKALLCKVNTTIIARVNIYHSSSQNELYQGWWIFGMWINWRYRGLGVGRHLMEMACDYAVRHGGSCIKLLVFKDNAPAINLYQNLSFRKISIAEIDKELREESKATGALRIIMEKIFNSK